MFKTSFKQRLLITGSGLCLIVVLSAIALLFAVRQHSFFLERTARAQHVYASYRAVSDHTYRKLSSMAEIVEDGSIFDLEERYQNQKALRDALQTVKDRIQSDDSQVDDTLKAAELAHFARIEQLAEDIIRGSEAVRNAITEDNRTAAKQALDLLRSPEVEGQFNMYIDEALATELREVRETERVSKALTGFLSALLPGLVLCFVLVGAVLIFTTWRALTRSLNRFEQAVAGYREGHFAYRIQDIEEAEFADLAGALNQMAAEIETQRERERVSHEHLESQIRVRTQELESSNAKLGSISEVRRQFLADISHELRTPLTIIQGEADVTLRGGPKSIEQYRDALVRVREQAIHTTRLVQDLLFMARSEDGKAPLHLRSVAVTPLVNEVCADLRPIAMERRIRIVEHLADPTPFAELDERRIKQVVTVLLDNAITYSNRDSMIEVWVRAVSRQVEIQVIDDGIGLSYHQSSQVFSRFYRGNDSDNSPAGTGLGLPVAKAIVDAHGGDLYLDGEEGRGTTATVRLPADIPVTTL